VWWYRIQYILPLSYWLYFRLVFFYGTRVPHNVMQDDDFKLSDKRMFHMVRILTLFYAPL
jgi:hypothetical protein